jgi:hypothetical protein
MDLSDILKKHEASKKDSFYHQQSSITSANSSAVGKLIESLSLSSLFLLRSLHQELTLEKSSVQLADSYLIDHIDTNLALLSEGSYSKLKYDKNIELGFTHQKKMKGLLEYFLCSILKWLLSNNITVEEFNALYQHWLETYEIQDLSQIKSSQEINEVFTLFLAIEEGPEFLFALPEKLEFMLQVLNLHHFSVISKKFGLFDDWDFKADEVFAMLDSENKAHLDGENVQFLVLALILPEIKSLEPIMLRKQTHSMLIEMFSTNGIVTLKCFKNYLVHKGWTKKSDLEDLQEKLMKVKKVWKKVKISVIRKECEDLSDCALLTGCRSFPSIWSQSISLSMTSSIKRDFYSDWEKLQKFLKFSAWSLGCTSSAGNKGQSFIKGTYLRDIPEFAVYLMNNFLEFEGQFHTSVSLASINQQTMCRVSGDSRFQAIHRSLVNFDRIMNAVIYEIISKYEFAQRNLNNVKTSAVSLTATLNSTGKTEGSGRSVSPKVVKSGSKKNSPISVSVKLINQNRIQRNNSRVSNRSKSPGFNVERGMVRSRSPVLGRLESYDKVMERLKK